MGEVARAGQRRSAPHERYVKTRSVIKWPSDPEVSMLEPFEKPFGCEKGDIKNDYDYYIQVLL